MIRKLLISFFLNGLFLCILSAQTDSSSITWALDQLDQIGGYAVTKFGNPTVLNTSAGDAIYFCGSSAVPDGLLIESNPLDNATEFTLEVFFRPDTSASLKQKYVHIENPDNNYAQQHRVLFEYEKASDTTWYLHAYMAVGSTNCTLASISYSHPYGQWHYVAIIYKGGVVKSYVNGNEELTGSIAFLPITGGHISIGRRMNNEANSWFKGAIRTIRFTSCALRPEELLTPQITACSETKTRPQYFQLSQNYPNPFNPRTQIPYHIAKESYVTLSVFDMLGRKISTLVDEVKLKGDYTAYFDASRVGSGVYYYRLTGSGQTRTRKMLLIK
jgi:hypothetical protein